MAPTLVLGLSFRFGTGTMRVGGVEAVRMRSSMAFACVLSLFLSCRLDSDLLARFFLSTDELCETVPEPGRGRSSEG